MYPLSEFIKEEKVMKKSDMILVSIVTVIFWLVLALMGPCDVKTYAAERISDKKVTLAVGDKYTLTVNGCNSKKVTWSSNNSKVAKVSRKGRVTAKKPGKAKIFAKVGKKKYTCRVTVKQIDDGCVPEIINTYEFSSVTNEELVEGDDPGFVSVATGEERIIKSKLIAFRGKYPEGMGFTNSVYYEWGNGIWRGGYGCAAFAMMLSDGVFTKQCVLHRDKSKIKVGDILRVSNNTHSVIVLDRSEYSVIVAEANYGGKVHWGREIQLSSVNYIVTRW